MPDLPPLDRVVVVGCSCSGKTTFAQALAEGLDQPHIELDALHWLPNWESVPHTAFRLRVMAATAAERWVVDGNYTLVRDLTWGRATTIIWLNYPLRIVLGRAIRRTLRRVLTRQVLYSGNRETIRRSFFSRDSILLWVLTSYKRRKTTYRSAFDEAQKDDSAHYVELRHPKDAARFIRRLLQA